MFLKKNWLPITVFIVALAGVYLYYLQTRPPKAPISIYKATPVEVEKPTVEAPAPKPPPPGETLESGHWHGDEWHTDPHKTPAPVESPPVSDAGAVEATSSVQIPDGITDPDVLAAWQRLDYIAKNPFQWGGRASDRALELMDELTPMWIINDHGDGEELIMTLDLLAEERDPRSAALLLMYQLDSPVSGRPIREALVAMGPASVPAVIARLNPEEADEVFLKPIIRDVVVPIVGQHRSELGGIVDYILLPRLEAIAALEDPPGDTFTIDNRSIARKALALLRK